MHLWEMLPRLWLVRLLHGWVFADFDVGGDAYGNRAGGNGFGGEAKGSEHGAFADAGSCEHGSVIGDAGVRAEFGDLVGDVGLVVDVVGVGVDVGEIGDAGAFVEDDLAAVVEHNVFMDGAAVFDGEVVAVGELDVVEDFDVLAEVAEDVAAKHAAEAKAKPVVEADGGAVEHLPEPDEGLAFGVFGGGDVPVVLGLKGDVAGV